MKHKTGLTLVVMISCLLFSSFPSMAGEWQQTEEEQWQYIQDDGEKAIGWLTLEDGRYYLDENGIRWSNRWVRDDGAWYYLDEDGIMATECWVDNYYVGSDGKMVKIR